ncbi:MAG TPA: hypothetical protein VFS27_09525 [Blastocatellia bacterium]|nr:hypothetical protein [Blastocatellia bacterium]
MTHQVTSNRSAHDRQYFFIHIPKAAGTSFTSFLASYFARDEILSDARWETIRKQPIDALAKFRLIAGHVGYDLAFYLKEPLILTVLRNPIDQLCSQYEYLRQLFEDKPTISHPDPDVQAVTQLWKAVAQRPFPDFLDSLEGPVRAAMLENPQARQLAQPTPYLLTDFSQDHLYQLASSRLSQIEIVGCSEHFAETVELTCRKTGWAMPQDLSQYRLNPTRKQPVRDSLDSSLRKKIERLTAVDMELYMMARERLFSDLRAYRQRGEVLAR